MTAGTEARPLHSPRPARQLRGQWSLAAPDATGSGRVGRRLAKGEERVAAVRFLYDVSPEANREALIQGSFLIEDNVDEVASFKAWVIRATMKGWEMVCPRPMGRG